MDRTITVELTVLCMVYDGDRILLQGRVKNDWKGYTFPGGHVESNESFVEAVIREIKEETGLNIKNPRLCGVKHFPIEGGRYLVLLYKTNEFSGELHSSKEGEMKWVKLSDLASVQLVDDFAALMRVMDDEKLSEFQYIIEEEQWKARLR